MPLESAYRLYAFSLYQISPSVLQLTVHIPGMHMVAFNVKDDLNEVLKREKSQKSMLTEDFCLNSFNPNARKLLYIQFSEYHRWDRTDNTWVQQKN
ncbi:hypothetical protein PR202_gb05879 [Eleusine coracana subsp. coracana]|uniref:Uncharacterized protein n=1 Tax=Eleusine coracana subsp. coracana TaxID=191504 RepID=A0AAV5E927_ELECO|nr:hypothetical protein PR202_gb05879 [Eleusine coracana subsp. coracana]